MQLKEELWTVTRNIFGTTHNSLPIFEHLLVHSVNIEIQNWKLQILKKAQIFVIVRGLLKRARKYFKVFFFNILKGVSNYYENILPCLDLIWRDLTICASQNALMKISFLVTNFYIQKSKNLISYMLIIHYFRYIAILKKHI